MQEPHRRPVPTPGLRRSSPSSPAVPLHDPSFSPARCYPHQASPPPDHNDKRKRRRVDFVNSCCVLPMDLISSILAKLPVRSILRFRSVCKSWKQLISEPTFIKLQVAEAKRKPPRILVLTNHNFESDPTNKIGLYDCCLDDEQRGTTSMLLLLCERQLPSNESSTMMLPYDCDGLILLYSKTDICVCNPSTGDTHHLPAFGRGRPLYHDPIQYLGFGLDPLTNLYKVVHFFFHRFEFYNDGQPGTWEVECEVFTLGRKEWRKIDDPTGCWICPTRQSVCANGSIYWLTNNRSLLRFDLGNEGIRQLLPPSAAMVFPSQNFPPSWKGDTYIMKGGGQGAERLWYVKVNRDTITYDIWELSNETTYSWTSIHRIDFQMATEPILAIPMLVIRNGRCILLSNQEKLQRYDIVTKECKTMLTIEDAKEGDVNYVDGSTLLCPSLYRETLVSAKSTN